MANKSPSYYTRGSIEVWDFIRDQELNYHLGCAIKYICRAGHKDCTVSDLKKALHYIENEIEHVLAQQSSDRISERLLYQELLEFEGNTEEFDR